MKHGIGTIAVHAKAMEDTEFGAVNPAIQLSTTFKQPEPAKPLKYDYSRGGNPTREQLEAAVAQLEGGHAAFAFGSGLAALDAILRTLPAGAHVVCSEDAYGGSIRLLNRIHATHGLKVTFVDTQDLDAVQAATGTSCQMILLETPTNPLLRVSDIEAIAKIAKQANALLVVDNTFMSPILQRPLELGADYVFHSATKYLGGHSDVLGGVVVARNEELAEAVAFLQFAAGGVLSPFDSFLLLRGLRTLHLRVRAQETSAREIALLLAKHLGDENVYYPGLPTHRNHEVQAKQAEGYGSMLSFRVPTSEQAKVLVEATEVFQLAESLGAVESLIQIPALMTHASVPPEMRAKTGITDGLIRVSVGVEETEDLVRDIEQALLKVL